MRKDSTCHVSPCSCFFLRARDVVVIYCKPLIWGDCMSNTLSSHEMQIIAPNTHHQHNTWVDPFVWRYCSSAMDVLAVLFDCHRGHTPFRYKHMVYHASSSSNPLLQRHHERCTCQCNVQGASMLTPHVCMISDGGDRG